MCWLFGSDCKVFVIFKSCLFFIVCCLGVVVFVCRNVFKCIEDWLRFVLIFCLWWIFCLLCWWLCMVWFKLCVRICFSYVVSCVFDLFLNFLNVWYVCNIVCWIMFDLLIFCCSFGLSCMCVKICK